VLRDENVGNVVNGGQCFGSFPPNGDVLATSNAARQYARALASLFNRQDPPGAKGQPALLAVDAQLKAKRLGATLATNAKSADAIIPNPLSGTERFKELLSDRLHMGATARLSTHDLATN
jgi:hypothetical protein